MQINITHNIEQSIRKKVKKWDKQVKFAAAHALTQTAVKAKEETQKVMQQVFDRPNKYTMNSMWIKKATPKNLAAVVMFKDDHFFLKGNDPSEYLRAEIHGGERPDKPFEKYLRSGGVLPSNMHAVPSKRILRDKHGNLPRRWYNQIISAFGLNKDILQRSAAGSKNKKKFFVGKVAGVLGIYQVYNPGDRNRVALILAFVPKTRYTRRLPFQKIAKRTVKHEFPKQFAKSYEMAKRTAFK